MNTATPWKNVIMLQELLRDMVLYTKIVMSNTFLKNSRHKSAILFLSFSWLWNKPIIIGLKGDCQ